MKEQHFNEILDYMFNNCESGTPVRDFVEVIHNMISLLDDDDIEAGYRDVPWRYLAGLEEQ